MATGLPSLAGPSRTGLSGGEVRAGPGSLSIYDEGLQCHTYTQTSHTLKGPPHGWHTRS